MQMQPILNIAFDAARKASKKIMYMYDRLDTVRVHEKDLGYFISDVENEAESIIVEVLKEAYPEHSFLCEHSGETIGDPNQKWIIDSLDGSTNFIHGFPHFCISIAFKDHNKIEHALIYDPYRQELFTASRGRGAYLNEKRIRVSQCKSMDKSLIGTGFPVRQKQQLPHFIKMFEAIFPKTSGIRRGGSAVLDLAYIASGRLDGYWELRLEPWDLAAAVLLIQEAGGLVGDIHGSPQFMENGHIVAGNPKIFKALLQTLKPVLDSNH